MKKATRALWRRRLAYRRKRMHYWMSKGNTNKVRHWSRKVREAKEKLGMRTLKRSTGIDVSIHNGDVDFAKVKAAGHGFVICKTSEGGDWKDPTWNKKRVEAVRKSGLKLGVYHYLRPKAGRSGAVEAKFFIKQARAAGWGKPGDIRPVIDFEEPALNNPRTVEYLAQAVREIKALTGKAPIIYTGGPFWDEHTDSSSNNMGCALWLAAYVKDPERYLPAAWKKQGWSIWQHTDKGAVPGVKTENVDQNVAVRIPVI